MKYSTGTFIQGINEKFFVGDTAAFRTLDGGGRVGKISKITNKSVHIDVGNKRNPAISLESITEINKH
ncbi:hypothetical protein [Sutcliffiella sp. FSL R7-0096]|uniref:hypothetical protein n=1 Tax=Sutcliffiella sp. FSL R7-0096 TaxID=2921670 RepID=UPI003159EE7A